MAAVETNYFDSASLVKNWTFSHTNFVLENISFQNSVKPWASGTTLDSTHRLDSRRSGIGPPCLWNVSPVQSFALSHSKMYLRVVKASDELVLARSPWASNASNQWCWEGCWRSRARSSDPVDICLDISKMSEAQLTKSVGNSSLDNID